MRMRSTNPGVGPRRLCTVALLSTASALLAAGCGGGDSDDGAAEADADAEETTTTIEVPENFLENPPLVAEVVNRMVDPDTPITALSFTADGISLQERGRPDAFVVYKPVGEEELGGTTTSAPEDSEGDANPQPAFERGATVLRSEMTPEEFESLQSELAAIDARNAETVSSDEDNPVAEPGEPYRFGETRADNWSYSSSSSQATRSPAELRTQDIESLLERTFYTAEIDWSAFKPLMVTLLAELDLGDTEAVTGVTLARNTSNPELGLIVNISAEGDRGQGSLSVVGDRVTIQRG